MTSHSPTSSCNFWRENSRLLADFSLWIGFRIGICRMGPISLWLLLTRNWSCSPTRRNFLRLCWKCSTRMGFRPHWHAGWTSSPVRSAKRKSWTGSRGSGWAGRTARRGLIWTCSSCPAGPQTNQWVSPSAHGRPFGPRLGQLPPCLRARTVTPGPCTRPFWHTPRTSSWWPYATWESGSLRRSSSSWSQGSWQGRSGKTRACSYASSRSPRWSRTNCFSTDTATAHPGRTSPGHPSAWWSPRSSSYILYSAAWQSSSTWHSHWQRSSSLRFNASKLSTTVACRSAVTYMLLRNT